MAWQGEDGGQAPVSPWAAILEAVREQLPSLDSDSSLSDFGDEEPFIFQRNQTALIPDLSEELGEDPGGVTVASASPEPVVMPVELASEPWGQWNTGTQKLLEREEPAGPPGSCGGINSLLGVPEETPTCQEGDTGGTSFSTEGSQSPPWGPQGEATLSPLEGDQKAEPPGAAPRAQEGSDSADRRALRRERRKTIEKDILHRVTRATLAPACSALGAATALGLRPDAPPEGPRGGPLVLSLQQLEEWDLDRLLQSLRRPGDGGDAAPTATWWADGRFPGPGHAEPSTQDRLLERLALLGASQSRAPASPRKARADLPPDSGPWQARSRQALAGPGFQAGPGPTPAQGVRPRSSAEPPTVFIDLRPLEPEPSHQGSWESSSPRGSSSSSEEEEEGEPADCPEPASPSAQGLRHCTGKSRLLQQLRAFRMGAAQPQPPASKRPGGQKM